MNCVTLVTLHFIQLGNPSGSLQIRVSVTQTITAGTAISVSQTTLGTTITNTAPDQTVAITGAGGAVVTGTILNPVKALIWQKSAVCSMRLQGMKVETVKDVRRGTFFTVASIMAGAGILRPELCGAIQGNYTVAA